MGPACASAPGGLARTPQTNHAVIDQVSAQWGRGNHAVRRGLSDYVMLHACDELCPSMRLFPAYKYPSESDNHYG